MKKLDRQYIILQNKLDKMTKMRESTIEKNYSKSMDSIKYTLEKIFHSYEIDGKLTFDEMIKYNRLSKLDMIIHSEIVNLFKENDKVTRAALREITNRSYHESIRIIQSQQQNIRPIQKEIDVTKTINERMAGLKWTERTSHHRNNTIYDIQKVVKEGLEHGDTYTTMTKNLAHKLNVGEKKARDIIRTESHRCRSQARQDSFEDSLKQGSNLRKKWFSMSDERVRDGHAALNGTIVGIDEDFVSPLGGSGKSPGNMNNATDDINCRCIVIPVLID